MKALRRLETTARKLKRLHPGCDIVVDPAIRQVEIRGLNGARFGKQTFQPESETYQLMTEIEMAL